jgi:hypothetical protein
MHSTLRILLFIAPYFVGYHSFAQSKQQAKGGCKPPIGRQLYHEYIDKEQRAALGADGKSDNKFQAPNTDNEVNFLVTQALVGKIDALQCTIESDTTTDQRRKVAYLRGTERFLRLFTDAYRGRRISPSHMPDVVTAFETAINLDKRGASLDELIGKNSFQVGSLLINSGAFDANPSIGRARGLVFLKQAAVQPERILPLLKQNPDVPFRDSLIKIAGYKYPNLLYDYAAAGNKLGYAIRNIDDPLVKTISRMASSPRGQMYFPFLDNIIAGKVTQAEIDEAMKSDVSYFRLLVKTRIDYVQRHIRKDTLYGMVALNKMLEKKTLEDFIKVINGLHEEPDAVRFRILQQLNAQELYYLAVLGESEIYTSSYTNGVYPLIMQKIGNRGDSLMASVHFDRFKKFIKIAAGYNTLNDFLKSFPNADHAKVLMTAFVNGLEKSEGLEDGVDVADSYVSIAEGNKPLAADILELTKSNYEKNLAMGNQRGMVMYNLLYKLFQSADPANDIDLSKEFGIPPVYNVSYESLVGDSSKQVVMHVFFYGDDDGRNNYAGFMRQFGGAAWRVTQNNQWVNIQSTKGKPITIYANKPLDEEKDLDTKAQQALAAHLEEKGIEPTIVVHRGHSYYTESTISYIKPSAKIVFLGSCGGYHLIHDVLGHAPDAHIIASKQIGKGVINQPFFDLLNDKLRAGNNIDWIPFWNEFKKIAGGTEGFEDYIPPHKNLGAIFIKAYKSQMGGDEGDTASR